MIKYKIVKYCRNCKKRFVVEKGNANKLFCEDCQIKIAEERASDSSE